MNAPTMQNTSARPYFGAPPNAVDNTMPMDQVEMIEKRTQYGVVAAVIGTDHAIREKGDPLKIQPRGRATKYGPDKVRILRVRDRADHPEAKVEHVCLSCGARAKTEKELLAAHEDDETLHEKRQTHVIAMLSEDPRARDQWDPIDMNVPGGPQVFVPVDEAKFIVGLLSNRKA